MNYYLELKTANCAYEIRVNDFLLFRERDGNFINTEMPFNQLIYKGGFLLDVWIHPIPGFETLSGMVEFTLRVSQRHTAREQGEELYAYTFSEAESEPPEIRISQAVPVKAPPCVPAWNEGETLAVNDPLMAALDSGYRSVWNALKNKDLSALQALIKVRESTYAACYGDQPEERMAFALSTFQAHLDRTDYELYDYDLEGSFPLIQCFGKVISMEDADGFHPVFFLRKDLGGAINIPVYFAWIDDRLQIVL